MTRRKQTILCSIPTRGRYDTTLPIALFAVMNQSRPPDKVVIFDDNDNPQDVRLIQHYLYLFQMFDIKGIKWEWVFAQKKGQHYSHQHANKMGYDLVWRVDDDAAPDTNVLEKLESYMLINRVGAVGGAILTPPLMHSTYTAKSTGRITDIDREPNLQWNFITSVKEVDHLHCSFLYRAGIVDYNLGLSRVAHREETLFTYELKRKGYDILVIPNANTWHLKNKHGGIRSPEDENKRAAMFAHDEKIFRSIVGLGDYTPVVLDNGRGDHVVFSRVLPLIKNPMVFSCYPELVPGDSIATAREMLGNIEKYDIYRKMDEWNWKDSLENAFKKLYNVETK